MEESQNPQRASGVQGQELEISKAPAWRKLQGAAEGDDLMNAFAAFRTEERAREDTIPEYGQDR
jgi:hypothetical protein